MRFFFASRMTLWTRAAPERRIERSRYGTVTHHDDDDHLTRVSLETAFTRSTLRDPETTIDRRAKQELFSQVGAVKKAGLNFDQNGRSKGTAEVILARRQDAMQAIKTYNGVKLDGRPLRIELVGGAPGGVTLSSGVTVTGVRGGGARGPGGGKKVVVKVVPRPGTAKAKAQGAKGAGAQGAGAQGAKKKKKRGPKKPAAKAEPLTQAQLDAQLDSYKGAAAMEA